MLQERLKKAVRNIPDFPKPGILFKDITPILQDPDLCRDIIEEFKNRFANNQIDAIAGVESRGFLFGTMLAQAMNVPFIIIRKAGKLPYKTISFEYNLEYGTAKMEMHVDAIQPGWNVLVHDDLLATGGTAAASAELIKMQNAKVIGFAFLVELTYLKGKERLNQYTPNIVSLISFE